MKCTQLFRFDPFEKRHDPLCTNLAINSQGVISFGVKAHPHGPVQSLSNDAAFQFICIDLKENKVMQYSLPQDIVNALNMAHVQYDETQQVWLLSLTGTELSIYALKPQQSQLVSIAYALDQKASGVAAGALLATWADQMSLFAVTAVSNPNEIDEDALYLVQWQSDVPSHCMTQYLMHSNNDSVYESNEGLVPFLYQRIATLQHQQQKQEEIVAVHGRPNWVWMRHEIMRTIPVSGTIESFCVCGEQVIGIERRNDNLRLWSWLFRTEEMPYMHLQFPSNVTRVRVIAMESDAQRFWCVEEYAGRLKVTLRESHTCQEEATLWCEGVRLPRTISEPYPNSTMAEVVLAYQDRLLLLGVDTDLRINILQIQ